MLNEQKERMVKTLTMLEMQMERDAMTHSLQGKTKKDDYDTLLKCVATWTFKY